MFSINQNNTSSIKSILGNLLLFLFLYKYSCDDCHSAWIKIGSSIGNGYKIVVQKVDLVVDFLIVCAVGNFGLQMALLFC